MKYLTIMLSVLCLISPATVLAGGLNPPGTLRLDRIECGESPKHYAYFSWDSVPFATSYRFYTRTSDSKYTSYDEISENKYKLGFNPEFDFYVAASSVNTFTGEPPSVTESSLSPEYLLTAKKLLELCKNVSGNANSPTAVVKAPGNVISITKKEASASISKNLIEKDQTKQLDEAQAQIGQLENQVQNLEKNLQKTQQRQTALEQLVNELLTFIRGIFKF